MSRSLAPSLRSASTFTLGALLTLGCSHTDERVEPANASVEGNQPAGSTANVQPPEAARPEASSNAGAPSTDQCRALRAEVEAAKAQAPEQVARLAALNDALEFCEIGKAQSSAGR